MTNLDLIATALCGALWQGLLLVAAAALLTRTPGMNSTSRYAVWAATLFLIAAVAVAGPLVLAARHEALPRWRLILPPSVVIAIVGLWALTAATLLVRVVGAAAQLSALWRDGSPVDDPHLQKVIEGAVGRHRRPSRILASVHALVPVAVGLGRPAIVLPAQAVAELSPIELSQVVMHELAHVERWDDWSLLLQRILQALLFFQPAASYAGAQIELQREAACDDWVIAATGRRKTYAETLARLAQVAPLFRPAVPLLGLVSTRRHILARLKRIVDGDASAASAPITPAGKASVLVLAALAVALAWFTIPVLAAPSALAHSNDCIGCNIDHGSWSGMRLERADFSSSNLPHADFSFTHLHGARFRGTNLKDATFEHADLSDVDFRDANLTGADLAGADLRGANFARARTAGVRLQGAAMNGINQPAR